MSTRPPSGRPARTRAPRPPRPPDPLRPPKAAIQGGVVLAVIGAIVQAVGADEGEAVVASLGTVAIWLGIVAVLCGGIALAVRWAMEEFAADD